MLCLLFSIPTIAMFDRPLRNFIRERLHLAKSAPESGPASVDPDSQSSATWPGQSQGSHAAASPKNQPQNPPPGAVNDSGRGSAEAQSPHSDARLLPGPHGSTPAWSETTPQATARNQTIESPPWQTAPREGNTQQNGDFDSMHRRLEQLGATYYLLETWGRGGALYRFHCKMAIGENPNFTRQFEATDSNPMVAMRRVLGEVETWHQKRRY